METSSNEKFIKKPTPHDDAISRADLAADMANMQQDVQQWQAQLEQLQYNMQQVQAAITRTQGAISYLQMRLAPEENVQDDNTMGDAVEDVTNS